MSAAAKSVVSSFGDLDGAPEVYLTPVTRPSVEQALVWCRQLATSHYENFHVTTFFLPKRLRPHFYSVYAFCRTSDDLGDEVGDTRTATRLLGEWRAMLHECFATPEQSRHPVFVALQPTIKQCELPIKPFDDLITAFEQDQVYTRHESLKTLEDYSKYSANPVGRLVLRLSGHHDEELMRLSDEICTGLQLANFYQDVVTDWRERGRRYLPADAMQRFGVTDAQIQGRIYDANYKAMMKFLVEDARGRLERGAKITTLVERDLAATLRLFVKGGCAILDAIKAQDYDTLQDRPVVTKSKKLRLLGGAVIGRVGAAMSRSPRKTAKGNAR